MKKKGFTLVELMVVVAIIAILAAVALPMYTRFKQKAAASAPIKVTGGVQSTLQTYFDFAGSFDGITLLPDAAGTGFQIMGVDENNAVIPAGANLAGIREMQWTGVVATPTRVTFTWSWGASTKCPAALCDGSYCTECLPQSGSEVGCDYAVTMITPDMGLDRSTNPTRLPGC